MSLRWATSRAAVCLAAAWILGGCGSALPISLDRLDASASELSLPLRGEYEFTAQAPFSGRVSGRITAAPTEEGFVAVTRRGVAWDFIGGLPGLLGPILTPSLFPDGAILVWTSEGPNADGVAEGWIGVSGLRWAGARTRLRSPSEPIELLSRDGRRVALMNLRPVDPAASAESEYPALADSIADAVKRHVYDPTIADSPTGRAYTRRLAAAAELARDDVEFIFGAVLAGRGNPRLTMPIMWKTADPALAARFAEWPVTERATVRVTFDDKNGIATLKSEGFLSVDEVEAAGAEIAARNPKGLVIDLRSSPGVTLSSLRLASWLIDSPAEVGSFFGAARRTEGLGGQTDSFPRVVIDGPDAIAELDATLERDGAAMVTVAPAAGVYRGPVAVLISKRTSASCEALVALLQSSGRATVFGQPTAGKPMVSRPVPIGQGWTLWLASYDFLGPDGVSLHGSGVKPDVETRRDSMGAAVRSLTAPRR